MNVFDEFTKLVGKLKRYRLKREAEQSRKKGTAKSRSAS